MLAGQTRTLYEMTHAPSAVHNSGKPLIRDSHRQHKVGSTRRVGADCIRNIREQEFLVRDVVVNGSIVIEVKNELPSREKVSNGVKVRGKSALE
jgi:hypothetical protein